MFISFEILNETSIKNTKHKDVFLIMKCLFLSVILLVTVSGCTNYGIKGTTNLLKQNQYQSNLDKSFVLYSPNDLWAVELGDSAFNAASVKSSIETANKPAQHYQNSVGGIEGLIGTILATQIIKGASSSEPIRSVFGTELGALRKYKDESVKQILSEMFSLSVRQMLKSSDTSVDDVRAGAGDNYLTLIYPSFHFSKQYRVLKTNLLVEILNEDLDVVFRNYYTHSSKPVEGNNKQCVNYWLGNEIALLKKNGKEAINQLITLVEQDSSSGKRLIPKKHSSIRYKNFQGEHYLRGEIIDKDENRVLMRTLRGHIRSAYVDEYL